MGVYGDDMLYGLVNSAEGIIGFLKLGVLLVTAVISRMRDSNGCLGFTGVSLKKSRPSVFIELEISRKNLRKPMISCLDDSESRHIENQKDSLLINDGSLVVRRI